MARVHYRKARKDYPDHGIKAGDMYYTAKIKTGPRSSRTIRQLAPIKQSQLTTSAFKSGWYAAQEALDGAFSIDDARSVAEEIRALGEEAETAFENMPEGFQQADTGQLLEARRDAAYECADAIETACDDWESAEEPQEPDYDDDEAVEEYEDALQEFEQVEADAMDAIRDAVGDMPE